MPRKSKLTENQWAEILQRNIVGEEGIRELAREYGVSDTAIRKRISFQRDQIKATAFQIIETEGKFKSLPVGSQIVCANFVNELRAMSGNMLSAAVDSSITSKKLAKMARIYSGRLKENPQPEEVPEQILNLRAVEEMQNIAIKANTIPLNLLMVSKDNAARLFSIPSDPDELQDLKNLTDEQLLSLVEAKG